MSRQGDAPAPIEALVETFLEQREQSPSLTPEQFAQSHPQAGEGLLAALQASLDVLAALGDTSDPLPERIGAWRVVRELGRGGMGVVYEVEQDGTRAARKRLSVNSLLQPRALQRFHREAAVLQRLRHPGIVAVHEVGAADGLPFLVMELVDGVPLGSAGAEPWQRAVALVRDVARALAAVHAAGLCHRDLKPQNVLVRANGTPVVVDFGLVHDDSDATLTATGDLVGTPRYLAPEQAEGRPADARTDVHALGLILVELLHGAPARSGGDRSALLAEAVRGLLPRRLPKIAGAPAALRRVLRTMSARQPGHRYPHAGALADDLDRLLAGQPVRARPPGLVAAMLDAVRFHPRSAGALAAVAAVSVTMAGVLWQAASAASHDQRTQVAFERVVLAWLANEPSVRTDVDAVLANAPEHAGARALAVLASGELPAVGSDDPLLAALVDRQAGRWQTAAASLRAAAQLRPWCPLTRVLLAEATEKAGQVDEADGELTTASRLLPESAALAAALGALRARRGDPRAAAVEYRRAVALRPDSFVLRYRLARCLQSHDAAAALAEVDAATPLLPNQPPRAAVDLDNLRGSLLDKLGRPAEALMIFERLATAHPGDAKFAFNVAYTLDRALRVAEAKPWYEKVLALDAQNVNASLCLAWLLATAADESLRAPDRAESLLVDVLRRDAGKDPAVLQMVREFGLRTGRIDQLVATLTQLAQSVALPQERRALLEHTSSYLQNGVAKDKR